MIGVSENEFGAELFQRLLRKSLDAGRRTDGQEHRRLDPPVRRRKSSEPRPTRVRFPDLKRKVHASSVSGEDKRPADSTHYKHCPTRKRDGERFAPPQFFWVGGCESDGQQNQRPDGKNIDGLAQRK